MVFLESADRRQQPFFSDFAGISKLSPDQTDPLVSDPQKQVATLAPRIGISLDRLTHVVKKTLREVLGCDVDANNPLLSAGLDSLSMSLN